MALRHFTLSSSLCAETIGAAWEVRSENNMERVRAMIAPPSYLYEVSSARAPEGFHSVKEEPQRKDFQVDFPFENPTGYKKPTARYLAEGDFGTRKIGFETRVHKVGTQ